MTPPGRAPLAALLDAAGDGGNSSLETKLLAIFRTPITTELEEEALRNYQQAVSSGDGAAQLQGALGLLLVSVYGEQLKRDRDQRVFGPSPDSTPSLEKLLARETELREKAKAILANPHVMTYVYDLYAIDKSFQKTDATLSLHAVGTTSLILKMTVLSESPTDRALKIRRPRYFDNVALDEPTEQYKKLYSQLPREIAPTVRSSGKRYILMD